MANSAQDKELLNQLVTFIQHDVPGLPAGEFKLSVSQRLDDKDDKQINDEPIENEYFFAVLGDRFRLKNPAEVLYTVFPEDNGRGQYDTVLPHVVLTKATFPWSRYPTSTEPEKPPAGAATEEN